MVFKCTREYVTVWETEWTELECFEWVTGSFDIQYNEYMSELFINFICNYFVNNLSNRLQLHGETVP